MTAITNEKLRDRLLQLKNSGFKNPKIVGAGEAFHYTPHGDKIRRTGRFFGIPVDRLLHATQKHPVSVPATDPNGVVYAYQRMAAALEEGLDFEIFKLKYRCAITAFQPMDAVNVARTDPDKDSQILILAQNIESFASIGDARDHLAPDQVPIIKTGFIAERPSDMVFCIREAAKLRQYVAQLSHAWVSFTPSERIATSIQRNANNHPFALVQGDETSTMLLTREVLYQDGREIAGWGDGSRRQAVVSIQKLETYMQANGENRSVDTTIHEWLHSIYGIQVRGTPVPNPDDDQKYKYPGAYGADRATGQREGWRRWYEAILTGQQHAAAPTGR